MEVKAGYKQTEYGTIPEDWGLRELRNIAKYRRGSFPQPYGLSKWYDDISGNPFIQVVDVTDEMKLKPETKKRLSAEAEKMSVFARKGSVIISLNGSVGRVALTHYDGFIDRTLLLFESFLLPIDKYYFIYAVSAVFREEEKKAPGAILKTITKEHLSNFLLPLPKIAEQEAIGKALSDADALIEALEQLIAKKRQVKQGGMEDLLSGKRRLSKFVKKNGYKPTEIGLIPEDWEVVSVGDISVVGRGRVISHKEIAKSLAPIYPVYSSQTSNNGVMGYIDTFDFEGEYITWTTDGANAGTVFYRNGKFNCTNVCGTIKLKRDDHYFVSKALSRFAYKHVSRHLGNPKMMNDVMKKVNFPISPNVEEQTAIAEILSDMDIEIAAFEAKLAKARHVKQGMMQELLTGKTRLL